MKLTKPKPNIKLRRELLLKCGWKEPKNTDNFPKELSHSIYLKDFLLNPKDIAFHKCDYPPVEMSLDAWVEWVWPVLEEKSFTYFKNGKAKVGNSGKYYAAIGVEGIDWYGDKHSEIKSTLFGEGPTKITALVAASMEALG